MNPDLPTLADLGEDALVARLIEGSPSSPDLIVGPGDDCAVIRTNNSEVVGLLKADAIIEGVHYYPDTAPSRIGRKAIARALSDIAAMGGCPTHALITIVLRSGREVRFATEVYEGLRELAETYGVSIAGGETAAAPPGSAEMISVSLTGSAPADAYLTRSGGSAGDLIYVTGQLGGSLRSGRHLDFEPRLAQGRFLAAQRGTTAMMDISDGLATDLPRLAQASGTGATIDPASLPCHSDVTPAQALSDGEDYELLVAVDPEESDAVESAWIAKFPDLPFTQIGSLDAATGHRGLDITTSGYTHFKD